MAVVTLNFRCKIHACAPQHAPGRTHKPHIQGGTEAAVTMHKAHIAALSATKTKPPNDAVFKVAYFGNSVLSLALHRIFFNPKASILSSWYHSCSLPCPLPSCDIIRWNSAIKSTVILNYRCLVWQIHRIRLNESKADNPKCSRKQATRPALFEPRVLP